MCKAKEPLTKGGVVFVVALVFVVILVVFGIGVVPFVADRNADQKAEELRLRQSAEAQMARVVDIVKCNADGKADVTYEFEADGATYQGVYSKFDLGIGDDDEAECASKTETDVFAEIARDQHVCYNPSDPNDNRSTRNSGGCSV